MKRNLLLITILFFMVNCSQTKTVLICGDHVCINKKEAEQHFEDNLSLEVRIIDKKKKNTIDLVELNLRSNDGETKSVSIIKKKTTNESIKILSNDEIKKKKAELKKKVQVKRLNDKKKQNLLKSKKNKIIKKKRDNVLKVKKIENKEQKQIVDICIILEKCNINEISKYLIEQGKKRGFPDITLKE